MEKRWLFIEAATNFKSIVWTNLTRQIVTKIVLDE